MYYGASELACLEIITRNATALIVQADTAYVDEILTIMDTPIS